MGAFILAWVVGEGIIVFRSVKRDKAPPQPRALLFSSGVFALLAIVAQFERARTAATLAAWGFDIAALVNWVDPTLGTRPAGGEKSGTPAAPKKAATESTGPA